MSIPASDPPIPLSMGVQLTTRCSLTCAHCYLDAPVRDIPLETIKEIIYYAGAMRCGALSFTGGEPTLHPRFREIVETLAGNDLPFAMVTNGRNFADVYREIAPFLAYVRNVDFSLDGASEEIHDLNRGKGSFRDVLSAAAVCRFKSIPFGIRMTVTKRNIHQLEEMSLLAAKLGARELFLLPLQPTPRTASMKLILLPEDLDMIAGEASRLRTIFRIKITLTAGYYSRDRLFVCPSLTGNDLFVTSAGSVSFCCHLTDYAGGTKGSEIIASLDRTGLPGAHKLVMDAVSGFKQDRIRDLRSGKLEKYDYYPCWYCLKYFEKVHWMADYPDSPWSADLLRERLVRRDNPETDREKSVMEQRP